MREIIIVLTAAHIVAGVVSPETVEEIAGLYASPDGVLEMYKTLGYASRLEAIEDLSESIDIYLEAATGKWGEVLCDRLKPQSIRDSKMAARLILGCTQFGTNAAGMISVLRTQHA